MPSEPREPQKRPYLQVPEETRGWWRSARRESLRLALLQRREGHAGPARGPAGRRRGVRREQRPGSLAWLWSCCLLHVGGLAEPGGLVTVETGEKQPLCF